MKTAALLIAAAILALLLPATIESIDDFRLADQEDAFTVTTAQYVTSANITLPEDLYGDETRNASLSSNVTNDTPVANSYASATNILNVTGLIDNASHRITVEYKIDRLGDYFGAGTAAKVLPVLMVLGILALVGAAVYNAYNRHME